MRRSMLKRVGGGLETEYQAILDYATTQGYTLPSEGQRELQNKLVVELKEAGIWNKLDTFANFATDGSSDFALIDWIRLTDFTAVNSPTFAVNQGFTGNATSSYIQTGFKPLTDGVNYQADSASYGVYFNSSLPNNGFSLMTTRTSADTDESILYSGSTRVNTMNNNNSSNRQAFSSIENFRQIQRNNEFQYLFSNGLLDVSKSITGVNSLTDFEFYLLGFNDGGNAIGFSENQINIIYAGDILLSESLNFYNALNTYINAL